MVSGNRVVPAVGLDRSTASAAAEKLPFIPLMTHPLNGRSVKVYKVAFDGTLNDVARIDSEERPTIVAHIKERIGARYYPGPGMQSPHFRNFPDALLGYSSAAIAERAEKDFFEQASQWLAVDPNVEIRVFVTGFSRGAAIARHFMNNVTRDWLACSNCSSNSGPEFFAVLYDTVATFQKEALELSLPPSVNYLIHVVAKDEPRPDFVPLLDIEDEGDALTVGRQAKSFESKRVHLLALPGSHSDIGAAYPEGVGDVYRIMTEIWLHELGLIRQNCWESFTDAFVAGKHDSRGWLDMLRFAVAPNSSKSAPRKFDTKRAQAITPQRRRAINLRLEQLENANVLRGEGTIVFTVLKPSVSITLERHGQDLKLLGVQPEYIDPASLRYREVEGVRRLTYRYFPPHDQTESNIVLSDDVWSRLSEYRPSVLSYTQLETPKGNTYISVDVDGTSIIPQEAKSGAVTNITDVRYQCDRSSDGTLVSPLKVFNFSDDAARVQ